MCATGSFVISRRLALLVVFVLLSAASARADWFTYVDADGQSVTAEARMAGSGEGMHALELADGQFRLVPQRAVMKREIAPGPKPIDGDAMMALLKAKFGAVEAVEQGPYIIGLILAAPLPKSQERRTRGLLRKASRFMQNVESIFLRFARTARFPTEPPRFPLVLLIFESGDDFEKHIVEVTGGQGLSAQNIAGFYSGMTNWLAVRLTECATFEVPLHEAIHQQVFNRHVFQRLAPIPRWFNEGIATGFEGNGERIKTGPTKINTRYARQAGRATLIDWSDVVADDRAFQGDVLAGNAYTHAWSLHWLLVSKHKESYSRYVKMLSQKKPLEPSSAEQRTREFEEAFGTGAGQLQSEFPQALKAGLKRQNLPPVKKEKPGFSFTQSNLGELELKAIRRLDLGGLLQVEGRLKNISPIRDLAFYVTVETTAGTYTGWHVPKLATNKIVRLKLQQVLTLMKNGRGGPADTFYVRIRSLPPGSQEAQRWRRGRLPVPVFRRPQKR